MRHAIDPKIDCVFKALLGAEENRNLLIHFLNALLAQELIEPIVSVDILNPYNDKEFFSDKLSVVDVKAQDQHERLYQIEIQLSSYRHLPARMIYNWADIYSQQLKSGQDYGLLKPAYAIWLLSDNLLTDDNQYAHHYKLRDENGKLLTQHGGIWLLELTKFNVKHIESEEQRWLKFFKTGEQLNDDALPDWMTTEEMKQAMNTLSRFSEKEREYFQYQARQEYLREQRAIKNEHEQTAQQLEQTSQQLEQVVHQLEQAAKELQQSKFLAEEAQKREQEAQKT
ncbi:Rpn family recombination-promoting nuclease/putative transposase [Methylocucumis oryzae]|uniref:Transposase n=1 Tax=Methylocucumis oryzae TaxID=1632867 RepID=A0A0F3IN89_9GAMM|nr:Rpn family recombination-promoting nuclease/putative transposase [Methylocucumis oryzae]KJV08112.1 hypothetical protein VZ94_00180 [Methylocucumis oryzae]